MRPVARPAEPPAEPNRRTGGVGSTRDHLDRRHSRSTHLADRPRRHRPRRPPPAGRGLARGGVEPPDDPLFRGLRRPGPHRRDARRPDRTRHDAVLRGPAHRGAPLLPRHRRGRRVLLRAPEGRAARPHRPVRAPGGSARGGSAAVGARHRAHGARGRPGELAAHPPLLLPLRRAHGDRRGRSHPPLPGLRRRALPAHRPGGDHGGHRRGGPHPARPPGALARGPLLHAGRLRGARRVHRAGGAPRGRRGGRRHHRRRRVRGQPALALPVQPDARLHGPRHHHRDPGGRRRDLRGPLVLPPGTARGLRVRRGAAALRHLHRGPPDRDVVRQAPAHPRRLLRHPGGPPGRVSYGTRKRRFPSRFRTREPPFRSSGRYAASFCLTWASDGFVMVVPSAKSTVGTVWLPPFAFSTKAADSGSCSMLISV
ncbi:putative Butyryl-CoA dehydrogenase [Streptomyces misionensis JCM 4497]